MNIFLAIPQYKEMRPEEIKRIKDALEIEDYESATPGLHPMVDLTIAGLKGWASENKSRIRVCFVKGDGNLPRVRTLQWGVCQKEITQGTEFDYYMVMDDDISFTPDGFQYLIDANKPIVGGIYTFKTHREPYIGQACCKFYDDDWGSFNSPFKLRWLNGGCILIKISALKQMNAKYQELRINLWEEALGISESTALWLPSIHQEDGKSYFLSEDYAFSERARQAGFDIWADWRVNPYHWSAENGFSIQPETASKERTA
jgi:hypothetical protein